MTRKILYAIAGLLLLIGITSVLTITTVPRVPYQKLDAYLEMDARLDSLNAALYHARDTSLALRIGWSHQHITPEVMAPLAGYGSRKPKTMAGIHDSTYVRVVVFQNQLQKAALVTADLLIIHPEVSRKVWELLSPEWQADEIYFTATHTHSGEGGWAPGAIGKLFAGTYDPATIDRLAGKIAKAVREASRSALPGSVSFMEFNVQSLVKNRIVGNDGIVDPWFKVIKLQNESGSGFFSFFSAHATCFRYESRQLSGDYPGMLVQLLERDSSIQFAAFGGGAMGSMTHAINLTSDHKEAVQTAAVLKEQIDFFDLIGTNAIHPVPFRSFELAVPLRDPYFKISEGLALRPYLFRKIMGVYENHIRILQIGTLLLIGLPCDFSGELSPALYEYARQKNLNLVLSSFNGEYIGYVIRDDWYDLNTYESRTMSWYGPDTGSYFSEIIKRIIDATSNY